MASIRRVPINQGTGNDVTVLTGLPAPVRGVYYLSASLSIESIEGDRVGCFFAPDPPRSSTQVVKPSSTETVSLSLTGALTLDAGQRPLILCQNANRGSGTMMLNGNLNAVLISSSTSGVSTGTTSSP